MLTVLLSGVKLSYYYSPWTVSIFKLETGLIINKKKVNCEDKITHILTEVSCLRMELHSELKTEKQVTLFCCYEGAHPPPLEILTLPINS